MRRVKIIATIGPATNNPEQLRSLVDAGMDVARLNFSHGDYSDHQHTIETLRQIEEDTGKAIGIMQDLRGPKIRTGVIPEGPGIEIQAGNPLTLTPAAIEPTTELIHVDYPELSTQIKDGDRILLDDGSIELVVESVSKDEIHTVAITGGWLGSRKGVNLPGVELGMPALTEKDLEDLRFGLSQGVDAIALSFVQTAEDIEQLCSTIDDLLTDSDEKPIVIAKLERPIAIDNLESILEV
jgi:pyruvate kinase